MRLSPALLALPVCLGCASVSPPPGGPNDKVPPTIVSISVDTNATNVTTGKIDVQFDEIISERPSVTAAGSQAGPTLEGIVLVSPRTGPTKVSWHRDRLTIEPRGGFRPNTAYRITLLPGIADIRGNVSRETRTFVFSTGSSVPGFSILGRIFDWQASTPAGFAVVEAIANAGTKDSLTFVGLADSTGQFDVGPLDKGRYLVRGYVDADNNRAIGPIEKWDTVTVEVTDHRPVQELLAIQRDTAPPGIQRIEIMDSSWIRVTLDKPFDPKTEFQIGHVTLKRADSSVMPVVGVMTEKLGALQRPRTTAKDSTPPVTLPRPAILDSLSTRPPEAKPSAPPPERAFVIHLGPGGELKPEGRYVLTVRGVRNLVGRVGAASYEFSVPKPVAAPPVKPPGEGRDDR